jgi:hypothetical protein
MLYGFLRAGGDLLAGARSALYARPSVVSRLVRHCAPALVWKQVQLIQLAVNELYKKHNAQRAFGDVK